MKRLLVRFRSNTSDVRVRDLFHEFIYGPWDEQKKDFYPSWARPRSSERNKCAGNKEDFDLEKFISNLKCELRQK